MVQTKLNTTGVKCDECERVATVQTSHLAKVRFLCPQCAGHHRAAASVAMADAKDLQHQRQTWNKTGRVIRRVNQYT